MSLGLALLASLAGHAPAGADAQAEGRACVASFFAGSLDSLHARFDAPMAAAMSLEQLREFQSGVTRDLGPELEVYREELAPSDSLEIYVRRSRFARGETVVDFILAFNPQGQISGLLLRPAPVAYPSDFLDYPTRTRLVLPITGTWFVAWGGRSVEDNYHASTRDQRFAVDLIVMREDSSHAGDGRRNEDYYAYGQPLRAPAAGTVAAAVDTVSENRPGEMNTAEPLGNHVIIDHGQGEFSFLAHLQPGSVKVSVGQALQAGALLGLCGNSGHSSEPHLHYHLQNSPRFGDGDGLPAPFSRYLADGEPVLRGEPRRGQTIAPQD